MIHQRNLVHMNKLPSVLITKNKTVIYFPSAKAPKQDYHRKRFLLENVCRETLLVFDKPENSSKNEWRLKALNKHETFCES